MKIAKFLSLAALLLIVGQSAHAAPVLSYQETFPGDNANTGWVAYWNSSTVGNPYGTGSGWFAATTNGSPSDAVGVNNNTTGVDTVKGIVSIGAKARGIVLYTSEYSLAQDVDSFSFYLGNQSAADQVRVLIQIAGNWYTSAATFNSATPVSSASGFATGATLKTLSFADQGNYFRKASNWLDFTMAQPTFGSGAARTSDLPSGDVTAFGLYVPSSTSSVRFDTFAVTTIVPEPATMALLLVGACGAIIRRRK